MKRILGLIGLVALSLLAVTFGEPDGNSHPYVGTLLFERPDGYYSCTGTLLNSTVVLTAGHCVEDSGQRNIKTWVKFTEKVSFAGIENYPSANAYLDDPKNGWLKVEAVIPHPQYNDYAQFPRTYDVGVAILRKPVKMATYGALPPENFLSGIASNLGGHDNRFTAVGYGAQGLIRPFAQNDYARYRGTVKLVELNSTFNGGQSAKFTNNPGTGGGTCYGDSGGPVFYGSTNMVTAVVSFGFTPCIGVDYQFRMDTRVALDFVRPFLR